nr:RecName: Full=2-isopropylmalate synthase; AltName: Full=Alpha-IPM synthase; AltName: Full=Alpha-isopropylmalate synthase [Cycas revoluta]
FAQLLNDLK